MVGLAEFERALLAHVRCVTLSNRSWMMLRFLAAVLLLAPTLAWAETSNVTRHVFLHAGQTYAVRSLCPSRGDVNIEVRTGGLPTAPLWSSDGHCTLNRTGLTFTVPAGEPAVQPFDLKVTTDVGMADTKMVIEPDCDEGPTTSCTLLAPGSLAGKFTYPGDQDWVRLDFGWSGVDITPKPNNAGCFVTAKVVSDGTGLFAVFVGGPSSCGYTATIKERNYID